MKVLVDTCIWSLALRSNIGKNKLITDELVALMDEGRLSIIGPIKQEILSAYKDKTKFNKIRQHLADFPNTEIEDIDYETAAEFHSICRGKGVQGSHIDFLICAISVRCKMNIFTNDSDFERYKKHLPIELYNPKS